MKMHEFRSTTVVLLFHVVGLPWSTGTTSRSLVNDISELTATDPCHREDGSPRRCVADFVNAAFARRVIASSTCGTPPSRHCPPAIGRTTKASAAVAVDPCFICNSTRAGLSHPASYLTDLNNPGNLSCWASGLDPGRVTLTASLGKKYEVTYVSLQFCSVPPSSMAIHKSTDHGRTWVPMQYYSTQCRKNYGLSARKSITKTNEHEAICSDIPSPTASNSRIAFVTLDGRPSAQDFEASPTLQDFITATDVRIELGVPFGVTGDDDGVEMRLKSKDQMFYSLADLAIGGRCKCNGHAHRCVAGVDGKVQCECRHSTAGVDCQTCKQFHYDRPWTRATEANPVGCTACDCNLHSTNCRFNMELFKSSGEKSGGVCQRCRHFTMGRNCHLCIEGYYRDERKPATHRKACKACECHPVGSLGKHCNQTNGQCLCKDGVTGRQCTHCIDGHQQTNSPIAPCVKMVNTIVTEEKNGPQKNHKAVEQCDACKSKWRSVTTSDYCSSEYAIQIKVTSRQRPSDDWQRASGVILNVFKDARNVTGRGRVLDLWLPGRKSPTRCGCSRLRPRKIYLLLGKAAVKDTGLVLDQRTMVAAIQWREELTKRLKRFSRLDC